jgi:hypothetical protein
MKPHEVLSEDAMLAAEADFPRLAARAGRAAHERALRTGAVVKAVNGAVVEQSADGSVRVLHALPPKTPVKKGLVLVRRITR